MSRREVTDCDGCGEECKSPVTVGITTGWSSDPAGGRSSDDVERLDLCSKCAAWAFGKIADKLSHEDGGAIVRLVRERLAAVKAKARIG